MALNTLPPVYDFIAFFLSRGFTSARGSFAGKKPLVPPVTERRSASAGVCRCLRGKYIALVLGVMFCAAAFCPALPYQQIIPSGHWVYDALTALSLESRVPFFSDMTMTMAEAEKQLSRIDYDSLSESAKTLYNRVQGYLLSSAKLAIHSDAVNLEFGAALMPEFYFKTNKNIPWDYTQNERLPFAVIYSDISVLSYVNFGADIDLGKNRSAAERHDNHDNFPFDVWNDEGGMDTNYPYRAYLSAGLPLGEFSGINFRIGRGDTGIGRAQTGSIILGDTLKGLDYAQLSVFSPFFRYSCDVFEVSVNKYLYLHVFQIALFRSLIVSFAEGAMVNAPFELRYLNPMMIIHGFAGWDDYGGYNDELGAGLKGSDSRVGSLGAILIDWRPFKGIRFYGMAAMNEFQSPGMENTSDDSGVPDAFAFQAGIESFVFVSRGYITAGAEAVYTYPYMYMLENKNWSFYRESREVGYGFVKEWLGTPFGPDTIAASVWAGYNSHALWSISAAFVFSAQGENSSAEKMDTDYYPLSGGRKARTPTGVPIYTYKMNVQGVWQARGGLSFSARPALVFIDNNGHVSGVFDWGFELGVSLAWRIK